MQIFSGFVITGHVRGDLTESGRQGSGLQVTENGVNSNDICLKQCAIYLPAVKKMVTVP